MESRVKALGHPVHPMLVMFPLGLLVTAVVFDFIDLVGGPEVLGEVAFWNITVGLAVGLLAAVTGLVDWLGIPRDTRAKRVGALHGLLNLGLVVIFAIVWLVRLGADGRDAGTGLFIVEVLALGVGSVSAWLGGELVDRLGVGVDEDANLNAPTSLKTGVTMRKA
jgi:uncharacterized membrane protein